jgi:hypothetical protein
MRRLLAGLAVIGACVLVVDGQTRDAERRRKPHPRLSCPVPEQWCLHHSWKVDLMDGETDQPWFEFPRKPGHVNKLTKPWNGGQIGQRVTMTATVTTEGSPTFEYGFGPDNPCTTPSSARPYFEHPEWTNNAHPYYEYLRWWSNPSTIVLAEGTQTIVVEVQPDRWSSVFGKRADANAEASSGFLETLTVGGRIGMTFGGGCFFGHGVWVKGGTAEFHLVEYDWH